MIAQRELVLDNVYGTVFMVVTQFAQDLVEKIVLVIVRNLAITLVRELVWELAEMAVKRLVQGIVVALVQARRCKHAKIVPARVLLHVKVGVVRLVKMVVKVHAILHVKEVVTPDAVQVAIKDARVLATAVALVLVTLVAKNPVTMVARELVKVIVLVRVLVRVKVAVITRASIVVWDLAFMVADGAAQTFSIISNNFSFFYKGTSEIRT
ncbi:MAG: hypothetical protein Q4F69_05765 [Bacteroidia bacterium]|nr:hypothetical protein [Bacteroidia bacterium]